MKILVYTGSQILERFKENHQLLKNIVLMLMLWKRPNPRWRIASISFRQGPSRRLSLVNQLCDCSPEGTRAWTICILTLSSNPRKLKIRSFYSYQILFYLYFVPDPKYSHRIQFFFVPDPSYLVPLTVQRICSYRILFYLYRILFYLYLIRIYWITTDYSREFKYHFEQTICLKIICAGSENTWVKPSNWLIS